MNVVVFGASGGTGRYLVSEALAAGHAVTAFVRDPAAYAPADEVRVATGDARDATAVGDAIAGQDAVLSALGPKSLAKDDLLERAAEHIIAGMDAAGVRRLVALGAYGALKPAIDDSGMSRQLASRLIFATLLRNPIASQRAMQSAVIASDLDYTIVNPPRLLDGPPSGDFRVRREGLPRNGTSIARGDVARFMVAALASDELLRASVYLAT